jgi:hypothetical protein
MRIKPKTRLLRTHHGFNKWTKKHKIPNDKPFSFKFTKDKFKLNFIGTKHCNDENSDTYKLIKKIITENKPKIIVVEGIPYVKGVNPALTNVAGEIGCAINLAIQNDIKYIGIETNEDKILIEINKKFKCEDIYGFSFLRCAKQWYNNKQTKDEYIKYFNDRIKKRMDNLFKLDNWNYDSWFQQTFNETYIYGNFLEYASPYNGKDAVITQLISFNILQIRDRANIRNLYKLINKYKDVVYIMGKNHVHADFLVLTDTFGKPTLTI